MKIRLTATLVVLAAALWTLQSVHVRTQPVKSASDREDFQGRPVVAHEVLVRVRSGISLGALHAAADAVDDQPIGSQGWHRMRSASRLAQELVTALRGRSEIIDIEPNYIVHVDAVPNDPSFSGMWNLLNTGHPGADIHATPAWDVTTGTTLNVVGVVDTGIDYTHPDLAANIWSAPTQFTVKVGGSSGTNITCPAGSHGFNAIMFTCDPKNENGTWHGTHVAGTIGAVGNNSIGVVGVNWTTRIMSLKFIDSTGSGTTADAVNAIDFAIQTKAHFAGTGTPANVRVLSNSWGGGPFDSALRDEIAAANTANVLFVAAAGNSTWNIDNPNTLVYPASYSQDPKTPNVVAVAATTATDGLAAFSNYGVKSVALGAPGENIASTVPDGGYGGASGTSMAAPHVSGAAMLILSACALNTKDLKSAILNNVDPLPSLTGLVVTGGRLNVDRAIRSCATTPSVTLTAPADGATYSAPANIPLAATASDPDGINRVEFYSGSTLIGTSTTAPYAGTWTNIPAGRYTITAKAYDSNGGAYATSNSVQVNVTGGATRTNVALASNGGIALASSTNSSGFAASGAINGDRKGLSWGNGGGWNDGTPNSWPDWLEVDFSGSNSINEVDVFSVQDNYQSPSDPIPGMIFTQYGLTDFTVQYWDGTQWLAVPGGAIAGNNLVWRQLTFSAVTTSKIRVFVTGALNAWSRITEVEAYSSGGSANAPPTVALTGPAEGSTSTAPATITVTANASDSDGTVSRVDFYANGSLIGSDSTAPYSFTWSPVPAGSYTFTAIATDNLNASSAPSGPVHVTVNPPAGRTNVALASNGATATASSTYGPGYDPSGAINGDRKGAPWGNGGGWNDGTGNSWPDWFEVDFAGTQSINEIDVFSLQDNYTSPADPTANMTFSLYGLTDFVVQYWDGSQWTAVPGGTVAGNNLVWRQLTFASVSTSKIRVLITGALNVWSRMTEVEAYTSGGQTNTPPTVSLTAPTDGSTFTTAPASIQLTATASDSDGIDHVEFYQGNTMINSTNVSPYQYTWPNVAVGSYTLTAKAFDSLGASSTSSPVHITVSNGSPTNVALASNGASAIASSTYGGGYSPAGAINGDRKGSQWGAGGGWNDATPSSWPDWLEVDFAASQMINEVDVFSVQDNYTSPADPTPAMTFTQYGLTDFSVQYWDGSQWVTVPGGAVSGNNLVWRQITFGAITTSKIRILVTGALNVWSRIAEVEAYSSQ